MKNNGFDGRYVMSVTFHHILRAVDISLRKTVSRLDDVAQGSEGADVLRTLSHLNKVRSTHVKFMESNPELFSNKKKVL